MRAECGWSSNGLSPAACGGWACDADQRRDLNFPVPRSHPPMTQVGGSLGRIVSRVAVVSVAFGVVTMIGPVSQTAKPGVHEQVIALPATIAPGFVRHLSVNLGAEMIGLSWDGDPAATFSVRALTGQTWTEWLALDSNSD